MLRNELIQEIFTKKSYLCVGLDTDSQKLPAPIQDKPDAIITFNKAMINATKDYCVAYKVNTAFYEAMGAKGWDMMQETFDAIPATHLKIADAKRGDIGNTSHQYARAFFENMNVDALTVAPYMGEDSIRPFLEYTGKWTIVLGLTSNFGSADFQRLTLADSGKMLYEQVLERVASWGTQYNLMFVTGATQAAEFKQIRTVVPEHFLLVPGVGAQGGSLEEVTQNGFIKDCGLLVNASRAVIYASLGDDYVEAAEAAAKAYQLEMAVHF